MSSVASGPSVAEFGPSDFTYLHTDTDSAPAHWAMVLELGDEGSPLTLDAIRERVGARVGLFDLFRIGVYGGRDTEPEIVVAETVDLEAHVTEQTVEDQAALMSAIADALSEPLPRPRPFWTITLFTVAASGKQSLLLKVHHSLSDGIAGAAFAALLADGSADDLAEFERFATSPRFRVGVVDDDQLARSRAAFEEQWAAGSAGRGWPALTGSGRRDIALHSASTKELRRAARRHGASVHEFLIGAIGRTVSIAPPESDGPQSENIRVTLPVTLDSAFRHTGNAVAISLLNLPGSEADFDAQIERARAELKLIEEQRLELALAAVDDAPPVPWAQMREIVGASMERMSPDIHIGINPGFSRVRSVLGHSMADLTAISPLIGYSFSITGLILGGRSSFGIVADAAALPGYPARFAKAFAEVLAEA
ncbi:wax ester/triacylglycerol synthase domain-containing protein [Jongsikchunia kroppenstedtii]|uniref:wax ester/triacylglycerol synthase domain-containing protein n=1 Tax=Jongsikchunia kroppenstedtii TaxID=1121721 RepID=UPI00036DAC29|nr:wax ester/triacylglycerol synthase domain-containing protein [Jongsikchunia kroppenstedtii]